MIIDRNKTHTQHYLSHPGYYQVHSWRTHLELKQKDRIEPTDDGSLPNQSDVWSRIL